MIKNVNEKGKRIRERTREVCEIHKNIKKRSTTRKEKKGQKEVKDKHGSISVSNTG